MRRAPFFAIIEEGIVLVRRATRIWRRHIAERRRDGGNPKCRMAGPHTQKGTKAPTSVEWNSDRGAPRERKRETQVAGSNQSFPLGP